MRKTYRRSVRTTTTRDLHIQYQKLTGRQKDEEPFEVQLSDESFETYELDPPSYTLHTTKKELKQMYYDMVAVRYDPEPRSPPTPLSVREQPDS